MAETIYSVLDIETTGFSPKMGDKIVEISILNINKKGEILDSFETLVNPRRDMSATWVHGITPDMVVDAPEIKEVKDDILNMIHQHVVVAHNASFDLRFLNHELGRIDPSIPPINGLCTMEFSQIVTPELPSRKLRMLCEYFDIRFVETHSAYYDSLATAEVFTRLLALFIEEYGREAFQQEFVRELLFQPGLPLLHPKRREYKRNHAIQFLQTEQNRLQRMLIRLPDRYSPTELPVQQYLDILDEILADRRVTEEESEKLFLLSEDYQIAKKDALEIHEEYLRRLVRVYLMDQTISEAEYHDLAMVAQILGIADRLDNIIDLEKAELPSLQPALLTSDFHEYQGKSVCFTGQLCSTLHGKPIDRGMAHEIAMQKGLIPKSGVNAKLDYLVVADPHTQSSKAQKARSLGVKIVAEAVFWGMLGVQVE